MERHPDTSAYSRMSAIFQVFFGLSMSGTIVAVIFSLITAFAED
jgi:hypothetical protein